MQYNEKYYLFYTLQANYYNQDRASTIVDSFKNFTLTPGSLQPVDKEEDGCRIRGVIADQLQFVDSPLIVDKVVFNNIGQNVIFGRYQTGEKVKIAFNVRDKELIIDNISFLGEELFLGRTSYDYNNGDCSFYVDYYDNDAVKCLKENYKLDESTILNQVWFNLKNMGISADSSIKSSANEFSDDILHTFNAEDIKRELSTPVEENNKTRN